MSQLTWNAAALLPTMPVVAPQGQSRGLLPRLVLLKAVKLKNPAWPARRAREPRWAEGTPARLAPQGARASRARRAQR